jgi:hypothetical protein
MTQIHPSQVGVRRYLPQILGRDVRFNLEIKLALLLFATLILSLDADVTFAHKVAAQARLLAPANAAAGD